VGNLPSLQILKIKDAPMTMQFIRYQKLFFLLLCILLASCRTFDDFFNELVGYPISHQENIAGAPTFKEQGKWKCGVCMEAQRSKGLHCILRGEQPRNYCQLVA
jgi:hypothetical protein